MWDAASPSGSPSLNSFQQFNKNLDWNIHLSFSPCLFIYQPFGFVSCSRPL